MKPVVKSELFRARVNNSSLEVWAVSHWALSQTPPCEAEGPPESFIMRCQLNSRRDTVEYLSAAGRTGGTRVVIQALRPRSQNQLETSRPVNDGQKDRFFPFPFINLIPTV